MKKRKIDNLIFFSQNLDIRKGGPSGYIANLKEKLGDCDQIVFVSRTKFDFILLGLFKFLIKLIPYSSWRHKLRTKLKTTTFVFNQLPLSFIFRLNRFDFKTIICHSVWDVKMIRKYLDDYNINAKLMLMSHTPVAPSSEYWDSLSIEAKKYVSLENMKRIEKEAFETADIFIFPAPESLEPYFQSLSYFKDIIKNKSIYYIPTGAKQIILENDTLSLRKRYAINTPYVISYLGRHNKVKGYDILQNIAKYILETRDDITFLIAGDISKDMPPLNHSRWIELGRTHPTNVFSISDLFILPNRQTYFDLVLIEVLSAGLPVLAAANGGNKYVASQTKAVKLFQSESDCITEIEKFFNLSKVQRAEISKQCLQAYLTYYTPEVFADNYKKLIATILKDIKDEH